VAEAARRAPGAPGWRERGASLWRLLQLEGKRAFSARFLWILAGIVGYGVVVVVSNFYMARGEGGPIQNVLNGVLALPLVALAVSQGARIVLAEQEDRTVEVLFSLPGSRGRIWLGKLLVVYAAILAVAVALALPCYFLIAEFPPLRTVLHAMVPAIFFLNLTLLFSLMTRSGPAAILLSALVLGFAALLGVSEGPEGSAAYTTFLAYLYPFLNPSTPPPRATPHDWFQTVVLNRITVLCLAAVWLLLSRAFIRRPERLL